MSRKVCGFINFNLNKARVRMNAKTSDQNNKNQAHKTTSIKKLDVILAYLTPSWERLQNRG
jgi:hypothetical protein